MVHDRVMVGRRTEWERKVVRESDDEGEHAPPGGSPHLGDAHVMRDRGA